MDTTLRATKCQYQAKRWCSCKCEGEEVFYTVESSSDDYWRE